MHLPTSWALFAPMLLATSVSSRFVMYADEWHPSRPTDQKDRAGIDHVVIAFAMANNTAAFQPKVPMSTIRSEYPKAKVMVAVGGWGDDIGFTEASRSDASMQKFADDVKTMLDNTGADGVDIDWEYPGGNGADYKQVPNTDKAYQVEAFPKFLAATRRAIGKDKIISIAVPGKKGDMIGYTKETGPKIWPSVDFINVMSYDLMNRRDHFTKHHTSVADSDDTIRAYLDIGAPPKKMNLGFAYYAKYFTTQSDCGSNPLNCPIVPAEDSVTGKDKLTSGAWTFEKSHMAPVDTSRLAVSYDGTCGADKGTKCATSCCSQYGNCGTSPEHCNGACQHAFGIGCTDPDVAGSWQKAAKNGVTDEKAGAQYYFDPLNRLFWTWDTPALITRKFEQIVDKHGLGGVMAWSLGEDSYDWSHIRQMASELKKRSSGPQSAPGPKPKPSYTDRPTPPSQKSDLPGPPAQNPGRPGPPSPRPGYSAPKPQPAPPSHDDYDNHPAVVSDPSLPYDVVWVDGTPDGPTNDNPTAPGSPADYSVPYPAKPASYETSPPPPPPPPPAQYTPHHEHEHVGKYPGTTETPPGYMQYENQGSACSVKTSKRGTHAVRRVKKARV